MADIEFNCPKCGKHLSVASKAAGMNVSCPACSRTINVPPTSADVDPLHVKRGGTAGGIATLLAAIVLATGLVASACILSRGMMYLGDSIKIGCRVGKVDEIIVKHGKANWLDEMGIKPIPYLPPMSNSNRNGEAE